MRKTSPAAPDQLASVCMDQVAFLCQGTKPLQFLRVNVSKYQNSRSRRQVIDFFIFCLNKAYGKLFSKNTLKGSVALYFFQNRGKFEIHNFASRPRLRPPFSD